MPPNLYIDKYRNRSEVCEVRYFDSNNASPINQLATGVPIVYDHKWTFRMAIFGYDISASIMDAFCTELLMKPTGEANKRNTSKFGFHLAADSMAHACLHEKKTRISFWKKKKTLTVISRTWHSIELNGPPNKMFHGKKYFFRVSVVVPKVKCLREMWWSHWPLIHLFPGADNTLWKQWNSLRHLCSLLSS